MGWIRDLFIGHPTLEIRRRLIFDPRMDITVYELALCASMLEWTKREHDQTAEALIQVVPQGCARHFHMWETHYRVQGTERKIMGGGPCYAVPPGTPTDYGPPEPCGFEFIQGPGLSIGMRSGPEGSDNET